MLSYIWKLRKHQHVDNISFCQLENSSWSLFYQIKSEQIIFSRPNETLLKVIEGSDDYMTETDKVEDKVLKWTQAAEEKNEKRKWSQWIVFEKNTIQ